MIGATRATRARAQGVEVGVQAVPREFLSEAVAIIGLDPSSSRTAVRSWNEPIEPDADGWAAARDAMIGAIRASASPERDDRLFPGDPMQFAPGGAINLAHGAAGVLFALDAVGADRLVEHEAWLVERATTPPADTPVGFYDGLHGVAYTLDRLGYRAEALEVLAQCIDRAAVVRPPLGLDLLGGWAGIALNLAHFADETGDPTLQELAGNAADVVANRLGAADVVAEVSGGDHAYAGLLRGSSGPALLFLRRYERTGETALLDLAATALRQELRRCVTTKSGALHVNEGWRTMPYLVDGSAGIGMVLDQYLAHRQDEQFADAAGAIRTATASPFYIQAGLFYGRAGMIVARSITPGPGTGADDPVLAAQVRRLSWHALSYEGGLAFPGEQLLRLSMDLASGTAGVLLAIGSALGDRPVGLPFLTPDHPT